MKKHNWIPGMAILMMAAVNAWLMMANHDLIREVAKGGMSDREHVQEFMAGVGCGSEATWLMLGEYSRTNKIKPAVINLRDLDLTNLVGVAVAFRNKHYPGLPKIELPQFDIKVQTNLAKPYQPARERRQSL